MFNQPASPEAPHGSRTSARRSPLLTYHELTSTPSPDLYRVETGHFARQLEMVSELYRRGTFSAHDWCLSFDDGHRSNAELALPLLSAHRLRAIFFITTGWTGAKSGFMTWSQLQEIIRAGHSVQSHGWSHLFLPACSPSQLEYELRRSREALEERLGIGVDSISMPGGRWNTQVLKACAAAGYRNVYTSDPLPEPSQTHGVWLHGRMMVRRNTRMEELERFLTMDRRYWSRLRGRHRIRQTLRGVLGDTAYHALWRRLSARGAAEETGASGPLTEDLTSTLTAGHHAHTSTD